LNGFVNPAGSPAIYHFDYGTTTSYGTAVPHPFPTTGSGYGQELVSAPISGLQPGTTYHYRFFAYYQGGFTTSGSDVSFTTLWAPVPVAITGAATPVTQNAATLNGTVNPEGVQTRYHFQYGTTTSYGSVVPMPDANVGSGSTPQPVSQAITGLQQGTIYHFRIVASNAAGTSYGTDGSFATSTPQGYSSVVIYNENSDGDVLQLWTYDQNTGGPWQDIGSWSVPAFMDTELGCQLTELPIS
jgi:hypothetical protein